MSVSPAAEMLFRLQNFCLGRMQVGGQRRGAVKRRAI
jgi:hypothetical protein